MLRCANRSHRRLLAGRLRSLHTASGFIWFKCKDDYIVFPCLKPFAFCCLQIILKHITLHSVPSAMRSLLISSAFPHHTCALAIPGFFPSVDGRGPSDLWDFPCLPVPCCFMEPISFSASGLGVGSISSRKPSLILPDWIRWLCDAFPQHPPLTTQIVLWLWHPNARWSCSMLYSTSWGTGEVFGTLGECLLNEGTNSYGVCSSPS